MSTTALSLASASALLGCGAWLCCAVVGLLGARSVMRAAALSGGLLGFTSEVLLLAGQTSGRTVAAAGGVLVVLSLLPPSRIPPRSAALRGLGAALVSALALSSRTLPSGGELGEAVIVHAAAAAALCGLSAWLARTSVLSKVVAGVLGAVLVATIGASATASAQASSSLAEERRAGAEATLAVQLRSLEALQSSAVQAATALAGCEGVRCAQLVRELDARTSAIAAVVEEGDARSYPGAGQLDPRSLALLASQPEVLAVAGAEAGEPAASASLVVLPLGEDLTLTALGARQQSLGVASVYAVGVDEEYLDRAVQGSPYTLRVRGAGLSDESSQFSEERVLANSRLPVRGDPGAVLEVGVPAGSPSPARTVVRDVALLGAGVLLLSCVLALVLGTQGARRLRALTAEVLETPARIRAGALEPATRARGGRDEVATLDQAFDEMVRALSMQQRELEVRVESEAGVRARLAATLESLSDGVLSLDPAGRVAQANPAAERLWAASGQEGALVGSAAAELVSSAGAEEERSPADALTAILGGRQSSWAGRGLLGGQIPVELRIGRLAGEGGGAVLVARDVRGEEEVERMKTEFLSNISHELRTPLTPITGYVSLLRRRPNLDPDRREEFLQIISDSSLRLGRVVDLLVDVASLEAGRVRLEEQEVDLNVLAEEIAAAWRSQPAGRGRSIEVVAPRRRVRVRTDAQWLTKAVNELVDNALKYSPADSVVRLEVQQRKDRAVLHVVDEGPGMDAELRETLFGAFTQADGSATRSSGGLGLGLAFVRRVADELGCGLVVSSKPGEGSRFSIEVQR